VTAAELWHLAFGTVVGLAVCAVFLLALMIGFCFALDRTKFRPTRHSRTVKNLDDALGLPVSYLPPDAPRGPADQLAGSMRRAA
jgi:predicted lipid-binding transport protein (Tim44 family)